jgi:lipopolysaccharide export system protein LptA
VGLYLSKEETMRQHKLFRRSRRLSNALLLLLASLPTLAPALESDKDQPVYIEADSVELDDRSGISTYSGNVELNQGTIRMTADRVVITQRDGDTDHVEAEGNPVTFQQKTSEKKGLFKARAKRDEYDLNSETIYLIEEAVVTQDGDVFKNDRITYNRSSEVVRAGASEQGKQRVRITIQSKSSKQAAQ